ncbi:MAG: phosphate/phosphite/phosphonate ABC transporter substrate-binding protein [Desulfuromonas sp.]|nr:phosphate/phosphite/phosphonate ABC transporter substrate-binding protein [Desulfuromonas sp.]
MPVFLARIPVAMVLLFGLLACNEGGEAVRVDLDKRTSSSTIAKPVAAPTQITLGIGSMITPKEGYIYYQRLVEYLEKHLTTPVMTVDRGSYQEFNQLLKDGELDLAFVCGGPYVEGKDNFGLELLVMPETLSGETVYYSYMIVPVKSPAKSLEDLRGRNFAFTDPLSNSGKLVPEYMLAQRGETAEHFFGMVIYTSAHDKSIRAVAEGEVDGAAVDSLIYEYLIRKDPQLAKKIRILSRSAPYGIPPVVVRPNIPAPLRERLRTTLLSMHEDPEGSLILQGMMLRRFVPASDAAYGTIREMRDFINSKSHR